MRVIVMPVRYNKKEIKIQVLDSVETGTGSNDGEVAVSGYTNQETLDFQQKGYLILRNFIPKDIIDMTLDAWKSIENKPEWNDTFFAREEDIINDSPKSSLRKSQGCYSFPPAVSLHRWLKDNLHSVLDMQLVETYAYTRKYDRGAYLKAHSDRPSCEVSATICLNYKTDDNSPWKIWVQKDQNYVDLGKDQQALFERSQGMSHRDRIGTPISLEVGDVLLYQGPNAIHWRDEFLGDFSYHMFLHFINHGGSINRFAPFHKRDIHQSSDGRPHSVFAYDGRKSRYDHEQSKEFQDAMEIWNDWAKGELKDFEDFKPSDYINHYDNVVEVEETENDKKRRRK